jgi:hypothetical protein
VNLLKSNALSEMGSDEHEATVICS